MILAARRHLEETQFAGQERGRRIGARPHPDELDLKTRPRRSHKGKFNRFLKAQTGLSRLEQILTCLDRF